MALTHTFYSTDTGAPSLTGQVGSGITVLDALLVNGYNSQTVTSVTRSSTTATVTKTSHGYRTGQILTISGANEADYNGNFRITVTDANTFTYTVANSPSTPATGTISAKVAPLGWTKPYSGTNLAVYRQKSGTNQFYFRADDTNGQELRIRGYETMSDANTGTGPFPNVAQIANSSYLYKSSVASSTARDWAAFSDGKILYLFSAYSNAASTTGSCAIVIGDLVSNKSGDAYGTVNIGSTGMSSTALQAPMLSTISTAQAGNHVCRPYTQTGSSAAVYKTIDQGIIGSSSTLVYGSAGLAYPHGPDGGAYLLPVRVMESTSVYRGRLPGIWAPAHSRPLSHLDEFTGQGDYAGKRFKAIHLDGSGQVMIEISDTWGT